MKKTVIINYGLSNLLSVDNALKFLGVNAIISQNPEEILAADILILPGVGAFEDGMQGLLRHGLTNILIDKAHSGTPLLGICLGMQMLFDESEEFGIHKGLGLIPGRVVRIPSEDINGIKQRIPHVSWDPLYPTITTVSFDDEVLNKIKPGDECYFIHSYEARPLSSEYCLAETEYGGRRICAVAQNKNVIGTQFHPEKSGEIGLNILKGFLNKYDCI
ncbi:MAG: imidazole glycerol phosphate synthase subunit HisH [Lachnospiraceae bacterium]|nr:imidazole glycerol phosphate synthase subunit HisH [Lachnospiraceae bacterium]